jgi:HTH-type transcriptional regulator/antitoxin MqsA
MPERPCVSCANGAMQAFAGETFALTHDGLEESLSNLAGWRCGECGEVEFDADSARRYAEAGDRLVQRARSRKQADLRRVRRKLGLSQQRAALLTGGGHNAFSRYERGEAEPMPAVVNLFRLLDRHPELLDELLAEQDRPHRQSSEVS